MEVMVTNMGPARDGQAIHLRVFADNSALPQTVQLRLGRQRSSAPSVVDVVAGINRNEAYEESPKCTIVFTTMGRLLDHGQVELTIREVVTDFRVVWNAWGDGVDIGESVRLLAQIVEVE